MSRIVYDHGHRNPTGACIPIQINNGVYRELNSDDEDYDSGSGSGSDSELGSDYESGSNSGSDSDSDSDSDSEINTKPNLSPEYQNRVAIFRAKVAKFRAEKLMIKEAKCADIVDNKPAGGLVVDSLSDVDLIAIRNGQTITIASSNNQLISISLQ